MTSTPVGPCTLCSTTAEPESTSTSAAVYCDSTTSANRKEACDLAGTSSSTSSGAADGDTDPIKVAGNTDTTAVATTPVGLATITEWSANSPGNDVPSEQYQTPPFAPGPGAALVASWETSAASKDDSSSALSATANPTTVAKATTTRGQRITRPFMGPQPVDLPADARPQY